MKNRAFYLLIFFSSLLCSVVRAQSYDETLLDAAAAGDDKGVVFALSKGADINVSTNQGVTALMYASQYGYLDIVKILVYNNANLEAKTVDSCTALSLAVRNNQSECAEHLIREGADLETKDSDGVTPLMYACGYGLYTMADMLIYYEANVNARAADSSTALHAAAFFGFQDMIILLLEKGADPDPVDKEGITPVIYASQEGYLEIVKALTEKGARVNRIADNGYNALTASAYTGNKTIVEYLVSTEKKWKTKGNRRMSPMRAALVENHVYIANLLRRHNLKGGWRPLISAYTLAPLTMKFNNRDFMFGIGAGLTEMNYRMALDINYSVRPFRNRQLVPDTGGWLWQYREGRSELTTTLVKNFYFRPSEYEPGWGVFAGVGMIYTWGKYMAVQVKPDRLLKLYPTAGLVYDYQNGLLTFGYEFCDREIYHMPPHRFYFSVKARGFFINTYIPPKKIRWL